MSSLAARQPPITPAVAPIPIVSTTIGAAVDSFYRSGMNSMINARLAQSMTKSTVTTGIIKARYFPNMHVQLPTRIVYLNGIKNLRVYLEREKQAHYATNGISSKRAIDIGVAVLPGVAMTPFSSVLEAYVHDYNH